MSDYILIIALVACALIGVSALASNIADPMDKISVAQAQATGTVTCLNCNDVSEAR